MKIHIARKLIRSRFTNPWKYTPQDSTSSRCRICVDPWGGGVQDFLWRILSLVLLPTIKLNHSLPDSEFIYREWKFKAIMHISIIRFWNMTDIMQQQNKTDTDNRPALENLSDKWCVQLFQMHFHFPLVS